MTLNGEERAAALAELPDWRYDDAARAIRRSLRFRDFGEAFGFITRVGWRRSREPGGN